MGVPVVDGNSDGPVGSMPEPAGNHAGIVTADPIYRRVRISSTLY